jgi:hypothetical protein
MPPTQDSPQTDSRQAPPRHSRQQVAQALAGLNDPFQPHTPQRDRAAEHGIPRSTLQGWILRQQALAQHPDLDAATLAFLTSPSGETFLRQVVLAAHLVFHQHGNCGLRPLTRWMELSHLDRFVGASYCPTQATALTMQDLLAQFACEERARLGTLMSPRQIAIVADENFHDQRGPCLVALEPCSNFLLVEEYASDRTAPTWKEALDESLAGLPVTAALLTSDQAKALISCADEMGLPHSPDLFHLQRDLATPLMAGLGRATAQAEERLEQTQEYVQKILRRQQEYLAAPRGPGRPVQFEEIWLPEARNAEESARQRLVASEARAEQALGCLRGLSDDYHPFEQQTGKPVEAEELRGRLEGRLEELRGVAEQAELSAAADQAVGKACGWVVLLVGVVGLFWSKARELIGALGLSEEAEGVVYERLLAGLYWQQAARRGRDAEGRQRLKELSERLLKEAWSEGGPLERLTQEEKERLKAAAAEAVGLFSRSSSCVEGRNGRLSLYRHGQTRLSEGRLKALTCLHNYFSRRPDGSTAAQRFFGQPPRDLFAYLLQRMPDLPRPSKPRRQPQPLAA